MAKSLDIIDPKRDLSSEQDRKIDDGFERRPERDNSGSGIFYLILGIIAVVVSTGLAVYILFKDNKSDDKAQVTPTATVAASLTAEATATAAASSSITAIAAPSTSATAAFKYTNQSIRIANGNNKSGEATRIKTVLEAAGFEIASTGNASRQYAQTTILYKTGQQALAEALKTAIASNYSAIIELSDQATLGSYDAVIALGAK